MASIPDYQTIMLPLLTVLVDRPALTMREVINRLAEQFQLREEDLNLLLPSGRNRIFSNRAWWARTYLQKAGLIESPSRGVVRITEEGRQLLQLKPPRITNKLLADKFPSFRSFRPAGNDLSSGTADQLNVEDESPATPNERMEGAAREMKEGLVSEIVQRLGTVTPAQFEILVTELLAKMGYGNWREGAARRVGKSGDGGIDGIIDQDPLGLDAVYIQAKRWNANSVQRDDIQKFVGALQGVRARKGVFITNSHFTDGAKKYAEGIEYRVVLIDGERLAELMIEHGLGVSTDRVFQMKRVDNDYFSDEGEA